MSRPASFYEGSSTPEPATLDVRVHYEGKRVGDLAGTNLSYAEQLEHPTELVFWIEDLTEAGVDLKRGSIAVFSATEGYVVDVSNPLDQYTRKVEVTPLSASKLNGLKTPDGTVIGA